MLAALYPARLASRVAIVGALRSGLTPLAAGRLPHRGRRPPDGERPLDALATERLNRLPAAERGITIGDFLVPIAVGERISARARHVALIVAGAIFIALTANIQLVLAGQTIILPGDIRVTLPTSPVPITAQTFSVLLVGGALGFRRGVLAVGLYLVLGLFLPVYAGHASGLDTYLGRRTGSGSSAPPAATCSGFLLAGALVGRLAELGWDRHVGGAVVAMLVGNLVIYLVGVPWLMAATGVRPLDGDRQGPRPVRLRRPRQAGPGRDRLPRRLVGRRPADGRALERISREAQAELAAPRSSGSAASSAARSSRRGAEPVAVLGEVGPQGPEEGAARRCACGSLEDLAALDVHDLVVAAGGVAVDRAVQPSRAQRLARRAR